MRLNRQAGRSRLGFTLIELMVAIVLVGIMAAAIIPEMRGTYEDALLRSATRKLIGVCSVAASRAISLNETHRVWLDRRTGRYRIERKASEGEPAGFVPAHDVPGSEGGIDARISIEIRLSGDQPADPREAGAPSASERNPRVPTPDQAISFYADGTADAVEILLQDREGFRRLLRINSTTARVQISELDGRAGPGAAAARPGGLE
jgi:type II secretion system protein H